MSIIDNTPTPDNRSQQERELKIASNIKDKNEKLSWTRRQRKIESMVEELEPLNEQLVELLAKRQEMLDKITALRKQMVKECVHPKDNLVHMGTYIKCKFCNSNLSIPRIK